MHPRRLSRLEVRTSLMDTLDLTLLISLIVFVIIAPWADIMNTCKYGSSSKFLGFIAIVDIIIVGICILLIFPLCNLAANPYLPREENHAYMWSIVCIVIVGLYTFAIYKYSEKLERGLRMRTYNTERTHVYPHRVAKAKVARSALK